MLAQSSFQEFVGRGGKFALVLTLGVCSLLVVFVSSVPIPRSVVATGAVSSIRATRSVQHDSGGVVESLPIIDGQIVAKGDALVKFDTAALEAEKLALATEIVSLSAEWETLGPSAPDDGSAVFSQPLRTLASEFDLEDNLINQVDRASAKSELNSTLKTQLSGELASQKERRDSLSSQKSAKFDEHELLKQLIVQRKPLVEEGYISRAELNRLQIEEAAARSAIERLNSEIIQTDGAIAKTENDLLRTGHEFDFERLNRLTEITREIADRKKRMTQVKQAIAKSVVAAPVSGQVIGLSVNTIGGYVSPAQNIAMVVPDREELIIDVRLNPRDIDLVTAGMDAKITFSAFPQRRLPEISAIIESIASDILTDPATGQTYYQTKLKIPESLAEFVGEQSDFSVMPGMPVDVFIPVARTSILGYLWAPVRQSFRSAFKA